MTSRVRSFAFYLPQFHPIAENDEWWGKGFTEWTNVTRAKALFDGHNQPRLPADLGFYDLRLPEVRQQQAELAASAGIEGFIYYHYWFNGRRLLNRPFDEVLQSGSPDFPFALCWANEHWQRNWDGRGGEILVDQSYSQEDDINHIAWLIEAFKDPRYIRVEGKPLFLVYRASLLPNALQTTEIWRAAAREAGIGELFLCRVESMDQELDNPHMLGFDAAVEFAPDWRMINWQTVQQHPLAASGLLVDTYEALTTRMLDKPTPAYRRFPGVSPSFDNTPRKGNQGLIFTGSSPEAYQEWVAATVRRERVRNADSDVLLFVNAWNEWAEGAILEPCATWGDGYLKAHAEGVSAGISASLQPTATGVLLAHDDTASVIRCLNSLDASTDGWDLDVVIVDNGQLNIAELHAQFPGLPIRTDLAGLAPLEAFAHVNQGIKTDLAFMVSTDLELADGWLDACYAALGPTPQSHMVCPTVLDVEQMTASSLPVLPSIPQSRSKACLVTHTSSLRSGAITQLVRVSTQLVQANNAHSISAK